MTAGALLSTNRAYRYHLWREWSTKPRICYIMLNPSTADEGTDDATIRVCTGRAKRMGFGGIVVVNLFAYRATDPIVLQSEPYPTSEPGAPQRNDNTILGAARDSHVVICAWGTFGRLLDRGAKVLSMLRAHNIAPLCIRRNKDGSPAHPLRIPYSEPLKVLL